jgi:hypothetical protein
VGRGLSQVLELHAFNVFGSSLKITVALNPKVHEGLLVTFTYHMSTQRTEIQSCSHIGLAFPSISEANYNLNMPNPIVGTLTR